MSNGPLNGIRVVEYGEFISGPFCAGMLGDLGADVIKVEMPQTGDQSRHHGPYPGDEPHPEKSGLFLFLNTNKRGLTLDLEAPGGKEVLYDLLGTADILVENRPPSYMRDLGLDYASLKVRFPRLVVTSITPFGQTGRYRDYKGCDLTNNAAGGFSFGNGHAHREPLTTPVYQASYMAGLAAALASSIAILSRDLTGRGQQVDVAEAQVVAVLLTGYHLPAYIYRGIPGWRSGNRMRLGLFPNCVLPCKDGYICIDCPQMDQYQRFLNLLGDPQWVREARYRDRRAMSDRYPEEAEALIAPWFMEHTKEEILSLCLERRIPCVPVRTIDEVAEDTHLGAQGFFEEMDHPEVGTLRYPGAPYRLTATPWRLIRPAPTLGQHNQEVLCGELGYSQDELQHQRIAGVA